MFFDGLEVICVAPVRSFLRLDGIVSFDFIYFSNILVSNFLVNGGDLMNEFSAMNSESPHCLNFLWQSKCSQDNL